MECSHKLKSKLAQYAVEIANITGENLCGVYVYGSLARGCYHSATSDVDIIVVTKDIVPQCNDYRVIEVHEQSGMTVDAVFLTEDQMAADEFPTAIDLLVKPISGYTIIRPVYGSSDFLLQRQDAFEAGTALFGPPPHEAIRPVAWELLAESLNFLYPNIVPHFKNPVLMLCRVAYAYEHRMLCSKREAGIWGARVLDSQWELVINAALDDYVKGVAQTRISEDELTAFAEYCSRFIEQRHP